MRTIETDPSRRRGKFRELVHAFQASLDAHGLAMPLDTLEAMLAEDRHRGEREIDAA